MVTNSNSIHYQNLTEIKRDLDDLFEGLANAGIGKLNNSDLKGNELFFQGEVATFCAQIYASYINNSILNYAWTTGLFEIKATKGNITNDPNWKVLELRIKKIA